MTEQTDIERGYEVPLIALADAHDLWNNGYEGKVTIVDRTVTPPVSRTLIRLAGGETLVLGGITTPSAN